MVAMVVVSHHDVVVMLFGTPPCVSELIFSVTADSVTGLKVCSVVIGTKSFKIVNGILEIFGFDLQQKRQSERVNDNDDLKQQ